MRVRAVLIGALVLFTAALAGGTEAAVPASEPLSAWQRIALPDSADRILQAVTYDSANDKIYLIGGTPNGPMGTYGGLNQQYDPSTNTWTNKAVMPIGRIFHTASYARGRVYVMGGWDNGQRPLGANEAYFITGDSWHTMAPEPCSAYGALSVVWRDSLIYRLGGAVYNNDIPLFRVNIYDAARDTWLTATPMLHRAFLGSAAIIGDTIFIAQASDYGIPWANLGKGAINPANPTEITWIDGPALYYTYMYGATAALDGSVYWLGGYRGGNTPDSLVHRYELATGTVYGVFPSFPMTVTRCNTMVGRPSSHELYVMAGDSGGDWTPPNRSYAKLDVSPTGIATDRSASATDLGLRAMPNPVRSSARIDFAVRQPGNIELGVYDAAGVLIRTLVRGNRAPGTQTVSWDRTSDQGRRVGAGVYFYRLNSEGTTQSAKAIVTD